MSVAAQLESIVAEQAATIDKLSVEREQYRKLYMDLLERCAQLEKGIVTGKKAERFKGQDAQAQLTLQMLGDRPRKGGGPWGDLCAVNAH